MPNASKHLPVTRTRFSTIFRLCRTEKNTLFMNSILVRKSEFGSGQCLFPDEIVNIMSFSRFLHLKFSFHASIFFLQIRIHFSLKKNLLLHPFWTPFRNNYGILQICEITTLKKEEYKSELEYDTNIICQRRHPGHWKTKIAYFT